MLRLLFAPTIDKIERVEGVSSGSIMNLILVTLMLLGFVFKR